MVAITEILLSVNQQALWVSWQLDPGAFMNVIVAPLRIEGAVDTGRLRRIVAAAGERFPLLRGRVMPGEVAMLSWAAAPPLALAERSVDAPVEQALLAAAKVPLDLEHGPMARFELLHGPDGTVLLITVSHLVCDGLSVPNLLALLSGGDLGAPKDLADIAAFHRRQWDLAEGPEGAPHREFWHGYLGGDLPAPVLPSGPDRTGGFEMLVVDIEPRLARECCALARRLRLTPMILLYTAYVVLLRRHTGQDELVVSVPTHGRRGYPALHDAVGFFSNAIPLRQRLVDQETFASLGRRLGSEMRRCLRFSALPQPAILKAVGLHGAAADVFQNTIFQYVSGLTREDVDVLRVPLGTHATMRLLPLPDVAGYRLQTQLREDSGGFSVCWKDTAGGIGRSTLAALSQDYLELLTDIVADPDRAIGAAAPSLRSAEHRLVLAGRSMLDRLHPDSPVVGEHTFAASPHQERMGFVDRFETGVVYEDAPTYHNLPLVQRLPSVPSRDRITEAFAAAVASYSALRTNLVFTEHGFVQEVRPPGAVEVSWLADEATVQGAGVGGDDELPSQVRSWIGIPFDLAKDLLIRVAVRPEPDGTALLVLVGHQAVVDRASLRLVAARLRAGDGASASERTSYWDWLRYVHGPGRDRVARDLAALEKRLRGEIPATRLPERRPREAVHVYQEDALTVSLPTAADLAALGKPAGVAPEVVLLAAFSALLSWYTGQDELVIGTTQAARDGGCADIVGPLSNLVPIWLGTEVSISFRDLLRRVGADWEAAAEHAAAPFDDLVRVCDPGKDMSRTALFDVLFSYLGEETDDGGLSESQVLLGSGAGKYDLHLAVRRTSTGFQGRLVFNALYFGSDQMTKLCTHLRRLLEQAADQPQLAVGEFDPITPEERERQLVHLNGTAAGYPEVALPELLRRQARRTPSAVALTDGDTRLSYRDLFDRAETIAKGLARVGVRPGELVGLHLHRGAHQVEAILAVLLAGAGYLPLDPAMPDQRKEFVLADAQVKVLIGGRPGASDEFVVDSALVLTTDGLASGGTATPDETPLPEVSPDLPAYCIYTSGTTGTPKGVVITHRNVARLLVNDAFPFSFTDSDVWTVFHSYHFDFSVWEMFGCLAYGGRLVLVTEEQAQDSERFLQLLREQRVTILNQTPSAFYHLAEISRNADLPELRSVIFGGERLDTARLTDWARGHPHTELVNMYGITEVTVHATVHAITDEELASGRNSVGVPIPTTQIYLMDPRTGQRLLPAGAVGELYVGGLGVAREYLRRPALSAERFVTNPFGAGAGAGAGAGSERLFRSGDLGRFLPDGTVEVLGRADDQVKLRGHRIELAEIESCLRRHPRVTQAVVLLNGGSEGRLVAFVRAAAESGRTDAGPDRSELRAHMITRLPGYMVPADIRLVAEMPLTRTGKADKKALAQLATRPADSPLDAAGERPFGRTAEAVAKIWADLLRIADPTARQSFFELGGHSLLAATMMTRLSEFAGAQLPLRLLFDHPRLQDLADAIDERTDAAETGSPAPAAQVPGEPAAELPASSFQERIFLAERVEPDSHRYLVPLLWRVHGTVDAGRLAEALARLVRRHEILRTQFEMRDGRLRQVIARPWRPEVSEEAVTDLDNWLQGQLDRPFDLASGRLLRCALLRVGSRQVLAVLVHHLVWDMQSGPLLLAELDRCYAHGAIPAAAPPPSQYRDFVTAEQRYRGSPEEAAELDYWASALRGAPAYLPVPAPQQGEPPGAVPIPLPAHLAQRLQDLQTRHGVSWFMAAATALTGVLHRWTGADDVTVGVTVDNRDALAVPGPLGPCLNAVVLRSRCGDARKLMDLLGEVRERVLGAIEHRKAPFETVVDRLNPPRRVGWTPYADVMLNMNVAPSARSRLGSTELEPITVSSQWQYDTKFGLTFTITESGGELGGSLGYRGDRIDRAAAEQLAALFARLLAALPEALDTPLSAIDLVDAGERERLRTVESGPPAAAPGSLPAMIHRQFQENPDRPAVCSDRGVLSYAQLELRVAGMAQRLRDMARATGGVPILAVLLGRGEDLVVTQLAAWWAGFAYCPIDPDYPAERIEFMVDDLAAACAVTDDPDLADLLRRQGIPVLDPLDAPPAATAQPPVLPDPDHAACLVYTSGTTGQPKASVWRHRGLAQLARWHVETLEVTERDRASLLASVGFDGAQWELWPYLVAGACVLPYQRRIAVPEIVEWLNEHAITMCFMPTALAEVLCAGRAQPRRLRWLAIGGSTFNVRLPEDATYQVCNAYGPSENTVVASALMIDSRNTLPPDYVGRPIAGTAIKVVDAEGQRCPVGIPGEIYLGGVAVADGYWRRPELTSERFLPGSWYRTGDRGRWAADGQLQFLGRMDRQLKIGGYRIEPQEIETALLRDPLVRQALVIGFPDSVPALVGYLVPAEGARSNTAEVAARLSRVLPRFMLPGALVWLDELPVSVHGKIDTAALPKAARADLSRGSDRRADPDDGPRTDLERTIAAVWQDVLGLDGIGAEDNFFDIGGNSLLLSTLHARLESAMGRRLPIHRLFEFPTIRSLAGWAEGGQLPGANGAADHEVSAEDPIATRARRARSARAGARATQGRVR